MWVCYSHFLFHVVLLPLYLIKLKMVLEGLNKIVSDLKERSKVYLKTMVLSY